MLPTLEETEMNLDHEALERITLASAYRANLQVAKDGMERRLPQDAPELMEAPDLLDEAILKLSVFVNRELQAASR